MGMTANGQGFLLSAGDYHVFRPAFVGMGVPLALLESADDIAFLIIARSVVGMSLRFGKTADKRPLI